MLKGQALDFYYDNKEIWEASDCDPVEGIRAYFEGPEYHRTILDKWSGISLQNIVDENPEKTLKVTRTHPACQLATSKQQDTVPGLTRDLQSGVSQYEDMIKATNGRRTANPSTNAYFTD
ncbi:hypothetical protein TSTA_052820 [Talaromyces stipitatus ATCC 10500]|uniref:Uncharacterized protein n=1 Tax=Talaromyces stipitatus (strain ATCC 10500 / CBS 375.48 / QM 6759 / NRRL 1006) TaxID=441959 RepID=B8MPV3_TALSN|nr:uncharacterized protein TSTA_052820 [Talaromyces stipitatus ATCC 10500]EED12761.1 hypothetical protein TSTA_052820 [Talaromyces stipitatus ATCC 10500]